MFHRARGRKESAFSWYRLSLLVETAKPCHQPWILRRYGSNYCSLLLLFVAWSDCVNISIDVVDVKSEMFNKWVQAFQQKIDVKMKQAIDSMDHFQRTHTQFSTLVRRCVQSLPTVGRWPNCFACKCIASLKPHKWGAVVDVRDLAYLVGITLKVHAWCPAFFACVSALRSWIPCLYRFPSIWQIRISGGRRTKETWRQLMRYVSIGFCNHGTSSQMQIEMYLFSLDKAVWPTVSTTGWVVAGLGLTAAALFLPYGNRGSFLDKQYHLLSTSGLVSPCLGGRNRTS